MFGLNFCCLLLRRAREQVRFLAYIILLCVPTQLLNKFLFLAFDVFQFQRQKTDLNKNQLKRRRQKLARVKNPVS